MVVGKILGNSGSEVLVKRGKETLVNRGTNFSKQR